jgi:hypothetical protein
MPETDDRSERPVDDERAPVLEREDRDTVAEARLHEGDIAQDEGESARERHMTPDQVAEMRLASDGEDGVLRPTGEREDREGEPPPGSSDIAEARADQGAVADQTEDARERMWRTGERDGVVEKVAERLRGIDALEPDRWRAADGLERQRALRSANAILADSFGEPSSDVVFYPLDGPYAKMLGDKLPYVTDGQTDVLPNGEIASIKLDERFLDPTRCSEPSEPLNALCHEYRHVYQLEMAVQPEDRLGPDRDAPEETANSAYVDPKEDFRAYENQPVERDSRTFAAAICQAVYRG